MVIIYFSCSVLYHFCRVSTCNFSWWNIFSDDASRKDYCSLSDGNAWHNHGIRENKYIVANDYFRSFRFKSWAFDVMPQCVDFGIMRYAHVRANVDTSPIIKIASKIDYRPFSHCYFANMKEFAFAMYATFFANLDAETT